MKQYAYIRVSSKEQNIDRQLLALEPFGIPENQIYCDHQSGKDFERPAYKKLIRKLRRGDLLIVKSIDRLGRNYDEILEQWALITKKIEADIFSVGYVVVGYERKKRRFDGSVYRRLGSADFSLCRADGA